MKSFRPYLMNTDIQVYQNIWNLRKAHCHNLSLPGSIHLFSIQEQESRSTFRSQHLNIEGLLAIQPNPEVIINPVDAAQRGIVDGEEVLVYNSRGEVPTMPMSQMESQPAKLNSIWAAVQFTKRNPGEKQIQTFSQMLKIGTIFQVSSF